jgi:hypothetical protein
VITRVWLNRLYETLLPPVPELGSIANLRLSCIPETRNGLQIVKDWIRETLYKLYPGPALFLSNFTKVFWLAVTFDGDGVRSYIQRVPGMLRALPGYLYRDDRASIIHDLVSCYDGPDGPAHMANFLQSVSPAVSRRKSH